MIETNDLLGLINLNNDSNPRPPAAYLKPFSGDVNGVCSNYQGLFCCDVEKRSLKYNFLNNQLTKFNLVGVVEGHSENTKVEVFKAANRLMPMVPFGNTGKIPEGEGSVF